MTRTAVNIAQQRFGRLVVVERAGSDARKNAIWRCVCDCGREVVAASPNLRDGKTKSCGCLRSDSGRANMLANRVTLVKHGHARNGKLSPTYHTWQAMRARCTRPSHAKWPIYGGRGITVCERWRKFEHFLADMGERPEGKTLDRIDVNGNYEPGNCRWATAKEQAANQR